MMNSLTKRAGWLAAVIVLGLAFLAWLEPHAGNGERDKRSIAEGRISRRTYSETAVIAGRDRHPRVAGYQEARRREALDLAERMRGPALEFPVGRMPYVGEEFPQDLLDELAAMNPEQFRTVVLAIGKDRTSDGSARTTLVSQMICAWMNLQENEGGPSLEIVLGTIEELFPEFPAGQDVLPVINVINPGVRWDADAMAEFLMKHWDRWGGPDSQNAEMLRQSMLIYAANPQAALEQMKILGVPHDMKAGGAAIAWCGSEAEGGPGAIMAAFQRFQEDFGDGPRTADFRAGIVEGLGERLTAWQPDEVDAWLPDSGLSGDERTSLLERMSLPRNSETALEWIRWTEARLPQKKTEDLIFTLGQQWAFENLEAAERWISSLQEEPTRTLAERGFLEVAKDAGLRRALNVK